MSGEIEVLLQRFRQASIDVADGAGCINPECPGCITANQEYEAAKAALLAHVSATEARYETLEQVRQDKYEQLHRELDRQQQEIAALRAENERLKAEVYGLVSHRYQLADEKAKLEQANAELRASFDKYASHLIACPFPVKKCSCGFREAKAALSKGEAG